MRDRDKQVTFYRDVLGLPVKGDDSDPNVIEFEAGAGSILLVKGGRVGDLEYGPRMVLYSDQDIAAFREELELLGIKVGKLKSFGDFQSFDATDPEGNPLQITNRA